MKVVVNRCYGGFSLSEAAEGAELEIVTIEGNQYLITDYDGVETIRTPTTTKWITVDNPN